MDLLVGLAWGGWDALGQIGHALVMAPLGGLVLLWGWVEATR